MMHTQSGSNYTKVVPPKLMLVWEQCTKSMQGKIKAYKKLEMEIINNPIKLLESIKKRIVYIVMNIAMRCQLF
jgi:hypothetical protein